MAKISIIKDGSNSAMGATFQNDATILSSSKQQRSRIEKEAVLSLLQFRLPVVVDDYDYDTNIATVRVATKRKTTHRNDDGKFIDIEYPTYRVRVRQPFANLNGGGVGITFPVSTGDFGWIEAADRNCDKFFSDPSKIQNSSDDFGVFLFQYGSFVPSAWRADEKHGWKHLKEDDGCIAIRNSSGDMRIVLNPKTKEIRIITPTRISCETPLVEMSGNLEVKGSIHSIGDTIADTISLKEHTHGGVQSGKSNTGKPQ